MRKYIKNIRTLLCIALFMAVQPSEAQVFEPHLNSNTPSLNREIARPLTLPFTTKDSAIESLADIAKDSVESIYVQNLNGEWNMQQFSLSTNLLDVERMVSVEQMRPTAVPQQTKYSDAVVVYNRDIRIPFSWIGREALLRLGRVSGGCYVYVNGEQVGYCSDSRVASEFNITDYVNEGRNSVMLIVYSSHATSALEGYNSVPQAAIEGDVTLISQPRFRIRDISTQTYRDRTTGDGVMVLNVDMKTHMLNSRTMTLMYELSDKEGNLVAQDSRSVTLGMREDDRIEFYARVPQVKLWSSEDPNLYTLTIRTQFEGRYLETQSLDLGFRKVAIVDGKLLINDLDVDMRSVSYDPYGKSLVEAERELRALKNVDVNTLILTQFEPEDWFFTLCDRVGLYVFNRANIDSSKLGTSRVVGGAPANDPNWLNAYVERSRDVYLSSHRYASAIGFILGEGGGNGYSLYEAYLAVKRLAGDRPVVCLQAGAEWNSDMTPAGVSSAGRDMLLIGETSHWQSNPRTLFAVDYNGSGVIKVTNLNDFADMAEFELTFQVLVKNRVSEKGSIAMSLAAGESGSVALPVKKLPKSYTLAVEIFRKDNGNQVFAQRYN